MRFTLITLAVFPLVTQAAAAQLTTSPAANPVGTWLGSTVCAVESPTCKGDTVVYRVIQKGARDSLWFDTRRVVEGREEDTGSFACQLNAARAYITCVVPDGKWRFRARRDSLVGQMRLRDGSLFLEAHATRAAKTGKRGDRP